MPSDGFTTLRTRKRLVVAEKDAIEEKTNDQLCLVALQEWQSLSVPMGIFSVKIRTCTPVPNREGAKGNG